MFYSLQNENQRKQYIKLLQVTGSLSNLFAESKNPFIYYRAMENIFCKAFCAKNYSRSDISVDAGKNNTGIGLKTFLQNNGHTFQKIAEFNKESYILNGLKTEEKILKVAQMRNERILTTKRICKLDDTIYHLLTRSKGYMGIYEEPMDLIDIDKIKNIKVNKTISFDDGKNEYNFNTSKSTLFKRFYTTEEKLIYGFNVNILDDPFEFLLKLDVESERKKQVNKIFKSDDIIDYIVLPLYSAKLDEVPEKSGLNHWNAAGRPRDANEVYIPIPSWIHRDKPSFFNYNTNDFKTDPFDVTLPSGEILSMKVAQQGGKGLMSNPNKALGKWILRDILNLKEGVIVTKTILDIIGIDSIMLSKHEDNSYSLDFLKSGSYEDFEENYKQ